MGRKYLTEVRLAWDVDAVASIAGSSRLVVKMPSWPPGPLQVTPRSAARVSGRARAERMVAHRDPRAPPAQLLAGGSSQGCSLGVGGGFSPRTAPVSTRAASA